MFILKLLLNSTMWALLKYLPIIIIFRIYSMNVMCKISTVVKKTLTLYFVLNILMAESLIWLTPNILYLQ